MPSCACLTETYLVPVIAAAVQGNDSKILVEASEVIQIPDLS